MTTEDKIKWLEGRIEYLKYELEMMEHNKHRIQAKVMDLTGMLCKLRDKEK